MQQVDLIVHAQWVLPVAPSGAVLDAHSVVVVDGRILAVLPQDECRAQYQAKQVIDKPNHMLMPGLVNAHTHAAMSLLRGYADDLPLMQWLTEHIWPAEQKWVDASFIRLGTQLAVAEMLRGGTTCFNEMYFFPDEVAKVAHETGMRATVGMIAIDFPTVWAQNSDEYIDKGLAVHDSLRQYPRVSSAFAPHAPYTVSDEPLQRIQILADELDVPIHMHIHETAFEVQEAVEKTGLRPLARLHQLGMLTPRLMAVHLTQLDDDEIALLAQCGVSAVHCPESNMKLASGTSPISALLEAGVNVAMGTDGAASNNNLDLFGEMQSAALLAKLGSDDASALPAHQAIEMATLNGAKALGLDSQIGSLEAGKLADMICVDLAQPATWPVYNPIAQLVYAVSRDQVSDVWVQGECLLQDGQHLSLDLSRVMQKSAALAQKIQTS